MTYRIFLVDDDRFLLDLYSAKFKNAGHSVETFSQGEDILTKLRQEKEMPDAILIDIIMPGIDGFETLDILRKEGLAKGSKIIILSNQGQESDIEKAKSLKVDGYIVKASAIPSEVLSETIKIIESNVSDKESAI